MHSHQFRLIRISHHVAVGATMWFNVDGTWSQQCLNLLPIDHTWGWQRDTSAPWSRLHMSRSSHIELIYFPMDFLFSN